MKKHISILSMILLLAACAHHRDVRPSADGVHRVVLPTEDKDEGYRLAMSEAEDYCDKVAGKKSPVIVTEQSNYTGSMNEKDYHTAKTASKVAQAVGGAGYVFGGKKESTVGGIVGLGGSIANGAIGTGYTYELRFRCQ